MLTLQIAVLWLSQLNTCASFSSYLSEVMRIYICLNCFTYSHVSSLITKEISNLGPKYMDLRQWNRCLTLPKRENSISGDDYQISMMLTVRSYINQGPVVQSIVSLTSSLRGQLIKCFMTLLPNTYWYFLLKKWEKLLRCKNFTFFQQKIMANFRY